MKYLMVLLIFLCFISCKSAQKTVTSSELSNTTNIANDISLMEGVHISELTDQIIKKLINEQLNIGFKQIKYDTDKPMVGETGKYPVVEEIEIAINRETGISQTDSIRRKTDGKSTVKLNDYSKIKSELKVETKEIKDTGLKKWKNTLIIIGLSIIIGFLFSLYLKK